MASEAAKIQLHFYGPCRRRYIGPLPSCFLNRINVAGGGPCTFNAHFCEALKAELSLLYLTRCSFDTYKQRRQCRGADAEWVAFAVAGIFFVRVVLLPNLQSTLAARTCVVT